MPRIVTLKDASTAEAHARIDAVLKPYLENLHHVHEASTRALVSELRDYLRAEFEDFGFVDLSIIGAEEAAQIQP